MANATAACVQLCSMLMPHLLPACSALPGPVTPDTQRGSHNWKNQRIDSGGARQGTDCAGMADAPVAATAWQHLTAAVETSYLLTGPRPHMACIILTTLMVALLPACRQAH